LKIDFRFEFRTQTLMLAVIISETLLHIADILVHSGTSRWR
jgi:hypothetical protein